MNQRGKKRGLSARASAAALLGSGVGLGLGLAGLGALWLQRTDKLLQARAADVDKQLAAIRNRQQANDAQLAADLSLFRQVLEAYQPSPDPGYLQPFFAPAPNFPPSALANPTAAAQAAYEVLNRANKMNPLPSLAAALAASSGVEPEVPYEPLSEFIDPPLSSGLDLSLWDEAEHSPPPPLVAPAVCADQLLRQQLDASTDKYAQELRELFGDDE